MDLSCTVHGLNLFSLLELSLFIAKKAFSVFAAKVIEMLEVKMVFFSL